MTSINIRSVSKRFGPINALNKVTLDVNTPMVLGILGPNGAGKTTLLKLITGILRPSSGSIMVNGNSVRDQPKKVLSDVGSIIEQPEFYPYLTGYESLRFVCRIRGMERWECDDEIERVASLTSISEYINRQTGGYSRGMKQRLGIAAAMVCDPKILILDEPTTGLDPKGMKEIREIIRNISRDGDHIVVLSTHLLSEAKEVCDRVTIINHGSVAYDSRSLGSGNTVTIRVLGDFRERVLDDPSIAGFSTDGDRLIIKKNGGVRNYEVVKYLVESGLKVEEVSNYDDLENTYISIVGKTD